MNICLKTSSTKIGGALCTGGQWSVFTVRAGSGEHRAGDREQES